MWNIHLGSSWEIPMDFAMVFFWLVVEPTPPQNDGVKVSWGYDILNWMESHKSHVPNHQPVFFCEGLELDFFNFREPWWNNPHKLGD